MNIETTSLMEAVRESINTLLFKIQIKRLSKHEATRTVAVSDLQIGQQVMMCTLARPAYCFLGVVTGEFGDIMVRLEDHNGNVWHYEQKSFEQTMEAVKR